MSYLQRIFNNCSETSMRALQVQDEQVDWRLRMEMRLHIAFCKCCKNFVKQSAAIDVSLKKFKEEMEETPPFQPTEAQREEWKKAMDS